MNKLRMIAMVGGTVAVALSVGFVMQRDQNVPVATLIPVPIERSVLDAPAVAADPEVPSLATPAMMEPQQDAARATSLQLNDIVLTSALPPLSAARVNAPRALPDAPADPAMPQLGCAVTATATAIQGARARLNVTAPCFGNERLTVHHNGMMFTAVTDGSGDLQLDVPVLAEKAIFVLAFANGKGAVAQTRVPEVAGYDRVVLQWSGREGFQIHALEFGASYGDAGHVWSGSAPSAGGTGFVSRLGDVDTLEPQIVEVYSFPRAGSVRAGTVAMSIEAEVTQANCGRDVVAESLELVAGGRLRTRELVLSVPDCSAIGDFLVLNNLVDDLKIAGN